MTAQITERKQPAPMSDRNFRQETLGRLEHLDTMTHSILAELAELRALREEFAPVLAALRPKDGRPPSYLGLRGALRRSERSTH